MHAQNFDVSNISAKNHELYITEICQDENAGYSSIFFAHTLPKTLEIVNEIRFFAIVQINVPSITLPLALIRITCEYLEEDKIEKNNTLECIRLLSKLNF
jgi:hypothetical protein